MIEVALLFCFIAVLSAVVGAIRGIAMVLGILWKRLRRGPYTAPCGHGSEERPGTLHN